MQFTFRNHVVLAGLVPAFLGLPQVRADQDSFRHEFSTGISYVRLNLTTETGTQYSFSQAYSYSFTRLLQFGAQFAIADSGSQIDAFQIAFYTPITFNFGGDDLRTDYFVRLSPGATFRHLWSPALNLQLGKRFKIFENVSWRPSAGVKSEFFHGDPRVAIDFIPLTVGIIF